MSIFEVSNRGARGRSASEEAFLAGRIAAPTQDALDARLRAPALEAAAAAGADVDALIVATGEAFSAEKAALDDHVVVKDSQIDAAVATATTSANTADVKGDYALAQGEYAKAQGDGIGDIANAVASADASRTFAQAAVLVAGVLTFLASTMVIPGTDKIAASVSLDTDGRPVSMRAADGVTYTPTAAGVWYAAPAAVDLVTLQTAAPYFGPPFGVLPGTTEMAASVVLDRADGRPSQIIGDGSGSAGGTPTLMVSTAAGLARAVGDVPTLAAGLAAVQTVVDQGQPYFGPPLGVLPGTVEVASYVVLDRADGRPLQLVGDGAGGTPSLMVPTPAGLAKVGAAAVTPAFVEPGTVEVVGSAVPIGAGAIDYPGDRSAAWAAGTITSPATATDTVTDEAVAAGVGVETYLAYETVVAVTGVKRASDSAAMTAGTDYTVELARGMVTNVSGAAMLISYTASRARKDVVSIDPRLAVPALTITTGAEKARNAHLYPPVVPAGHQEIGRITRKSTRAIYAPTWRFRNGVRVDLLAQEAEAHDYNACILAPIINRLQTGKRVRVIGHGNSRVGIGNNGNYAKLNTNPNSSYSADGAQAWLRDTPGYLARYSQADRALFGFADAQRESFDLSPGYNLPAGTPDGWGAVHSRLGYAWEFIAQLHRMYPDALIEYRNWGIGGTSSEATITGDGRGNALYPARWSAVQADIIAGQTLYLPIDPMNELGSTESYANWRTLAAGAQALGAVVHFMGHLRTDTRWRPGGIPGAAFSAQEFARAAYDSGSAISDSWRLVSPKMLCGLGLVDDEMMDATTTNHEGVPLSRALGRDAAKFYI